MTSSTDHGADPTHERLLRPDDLVRETSTAGADATRRRSAWWRRTPPKHRRDVGDDAA